MMGESGATHRARAHPRICWFLLIGGVVALWPLQRAMDRASRPLSENPEVLYFASGETLRRLSMGFDGLLADIYWTRAVQYYGRQRLEQARRFDLLGPLIEIATELDPHLLIAYRFGAIFLAEKPPEGAGKPEEALQLVRRGIVANPDYWRFWQDVGFIEYWDLKDYKAAARAFEIGAKQPGALVWMRAMAATVAAQGGEVQTSRLLWSEIYSTAESEQVRQSALKHLAALQAQEEMARLNAIVAQYQKERGNSPHSLDDLVHARYLKAILLDPSGAPYVLKADGRVGLGPGSAIDLNLLSTPASSLQP